MKLVRRRRAKGGNKGKWRAAGAPKQKMKENGELQARRGKKKEMARRRRAEAKNEENCAPQARPSKNKHVALYSFVFPLMKTKNETKIKSH